MTVGLNLILGASAVLFAVGSFAVVARRSAIVMLMGTQFMFAAGAIAFVAFGKFGRGAEAVAAGSAVAIFVAITTAAELAIGAAMAVLLYRASRAFFLDSDGG
jgi:NADH-quinone oxidoreductase subunit K/NAD(P)H-quinone oxidoreductase subunit 4L